MLTSLESAADVVYAAMRPTTEQRWPLLDERCGAEVWVKHENHTPVGAFKVRGGLVYIDHLRRSAPDVRGVVAATRGNHGQSIAFAARRYGIPCAAVVPHGNSVSKNRAMQALGAELIERGHDFQASLEAAALIAAERGWHLVPSITRRKNASAASWLRRPCTRMSSTLPSWSTARHSQYLQPLIFSCISSMCHLSPGQGRRWRTPSAKVCPNFLHHRRRVS